MRAVKVTLSTAVLAVLVAASSPSATVHDSSLVERTATPSQAPSNQRAQLQWYQDPIAITLGLLALFAIGDIAVLFTTNNRRAQHRSLGRTTAQPLA
jgi:hypothetical protein